ncbi:all-trans retinoic acid-induced differentiation factor [Gastrophryne carolinensis]
MALAKNDSLWLALAKNDSLWLALAKNDSLWLALAKIDRLWLALAKNDSLWLALAKNDSLWLALAKNDSLWLALAKIDRLWLALAKNDSLWLALAKIDRLWLAPAMIPSSRLDLWNCSISQLDSGMNLTASVMVIDLSENPLQELQQVLFQGLTALQYLALPLNISCPGGDDAWENVDSHLGYRICQNQHSACNTTGGSALLCPENSLCAPDGPGYTQCICTPEFSGYKCLREGSFPTFMFFGILCSVTFSLTLLLWCTQRKKVKNQ